MAKHTTLASLFTDIAAAIRAKTGKTDKLVADDFPTAIAGITTGLNTSDATVTAADVASGVIAYGKDGKVTGMVTEKKSGNQTYSADTLGASAGRLIMRRQAGTDVLIRAAAYVQMRAPLSDLGNAVASDVAAGKTFTSAAGLKVTGTNTAAAGASAIQYDFLTSPTRKTARRLKVTITRSTKPVVLYWEITPVSSYSGEDGLLMYGTGVRVGGLSAYGSIRVITGVKDTAASTGYALNHYAYSVTAITVEEGSTAGTWDITFDTGSTMSATPTNYRVGLLTGPAS